MAESAFSVGVWLLGIFQGFLLHWCIQAVQRMDKGTKPNLNC